MQSGAPTRVFKVRFCHLLRTAELLCTAGAPEVQAPAASTSSTVLDLEKSRSQESGPLAKDPLSLRYS